MTRPGRFDTRTSRASRMRRSKAPLGWATALAAFALLCGLLLLLNRDAPKDTAPSTADQVEQALDETKTAQKALASQNYGEVKAALKTLRTTLEQTLKQLRPPAETALPR